MHSLKEASVTNILTLNSICLPSPGNSGENYYRINENVIYEKISNITRITLCLSSSNAAARPSYCS